MQPQLLTVAAGVHAWIGAGGDSNAGAIETPHGIVAIDAQQYPRLAKQFRAAAEAKVVFLGDLLFHGRFPWLGDCDLDGLIDQLARVLRLDVAVVIPGHGMPTDLAQVARFRGMLAALRGAVAAAIKAGASEEAAVLEVKLPHYAAVPRYADWLPHDVRAAYRYLRR